MLAINFRLRSANNYLTLKQGRELNAGGTRAMHSATPAAYKATATAIAAPLHRFSAFRPLNWNKIVHTAQIALFTSHPGTGHTCIYIDKANFIVAFGCLPSAMNFISLATIQSISSNPELIKNTHKLNIEKTQVFFYWKYICILSRNFSTV